MTPQTPLQIIDYKYESRIASQMKTKDYIMAMLRLCTKLKNGRKAVVFFLVVIAMCTLPQYVVKVVKVNITEVSEEINEEEGPKQPKKDTITVVTAYWNLGSFQKGGPQKWHKPDLYKKWMVTFQYMTNPLVAFVDDEKFANHLRHLRKNMANATKVILIEKSKIWSFGLKDRIRDIYSKRQYPKFYPNTVLPGYSCAQHSKYDSVQMAIEKNYFHTDYYTWLDIGYFRQELNNTRRFELVLPQHFNLNRMSFNEVYSFQNISIKKIFYENKVWVGGGMVLGKFDIFLNFIAAYKKATEIFINMSLMNTDQQVLYGMFSRQGRTLFKPTIELQTYGTTGWFNLGWRCHRYVNDSSFPIQELSSDFL